MENGSPTGPTGDMIADTAVERWTHADVDCVIRHGSWPALNGYVRLPEPLRTAWPDPDHVTLQLPLEQGVSRGLDYGPDPHGWVGFTTTGYKSVWPITELQGRVPESLLAQARLLNDLGERWVQAGGGVDPRHQWTVAELREVVNQLAEQAASLAAAAAKPATNGGR